MSEIRNINSFPFSIRQRTGDWCIPASIEAVTKYFRPNSQVNQETIWNLFDQARRRQGQPNLEIHFEAVKALVIDHGPEFSWTRCSVVGHPELADFTQFVAKVRTCIEQSIPPIISTPLLLPEGEWSGRWHMLTAVGVNNGTLQVHDPNPNVSSPRDVTTEWLRSALRSANSVATQLLLLTPQ